MHRLKELFVVSSLGLCVNIVGIMSFDHAHHHHGHGHDHGHDHSNENMHGIYLHILADTLGSLAVVISTALVYYTGWAGFDPLASCMIAALIFASAIPLVKSTANTLLLSLPADVEYALRDTLSGVGNLKGVAAYSVPKFWLDDLGGSCGHDHGHDHDHAHAHGHDHSHSHDNHDHDHGHDHSHSHNHSHAHSHSHAPSPSTSSTPSTPHLPKVLGTIHIIASRGADIEDLRQRAVAYFKEKNMDVVVQVEREGEGGAGGTKCWCGGGSTGTGNGSMR